jgi:NAD(P)-dependent dehydrogenase (short-subunit alcohol dehydrogenase family)
MTPDGTLPLSGRRAILTGAGSGIGEACAHMLAAQGADVAVLDIRADAVERVVAELTAGGARAVGAECDVASEDSVAAAVATASGALGGLDAVVACAGITRTGETDALPLDEWETMIRINLTGAFLTLKHTLGALVAAGGGAVVTIGSVASLVAAGRASSYDASKGGVLQLTKAIAAEYADRNIRANCVCPGLVGTALAENSQSLYGSFDTGAGPATARRTRPPIARAADPREIASVVAFLCSDASSFMTGAAVPVDGGFTAV